jgi:glycosyltransferase involved in cell wall biosynthesis
VNAADTARRLSVIIPTHNRADLIAEAVESVLGQTVPPRELVVVDDSSSDRTPEVLQGFGDSIRVLRTETNVERGHARNLGATEADGELLAFLDSDDAWEPDKLLTQLSGGEPDAPSVTGLRFVNGNGTEEGVYLPPPNSDQRLTIDNYCLGAPSSLILPRAAYEEVGGFPEALEVQGSEDWVFLVKLLWAGWPIQVVRQPLVRYRVHSGSWTQRAENLERSMWSACSWLDE